jgi:hypothetical protein
VTTLTPPPIMRMAIVKEPIVLVIKRRKETVKHVP